MPLDVSTMQTVGNQPAPVATYSPKFFSDKLTGRGGNTPGILSQANSPMCTDPKLRTQPTDSETKRYKFRQNQTTVIHLPMTPLHEDAAAYMNVVERPPLDEMFKIAWDNGVELYLHLAIQAITIEDTDIPADPATGAKHRVDHEYRFSYAATYYCVRDAAKTGHKLDTYPLLGIRPTENMYWTEYTSNPMQDVAVKYVQSLLANAWIVDQNGLKVYLTGYNVYDTVCRRSETWQTSMDKTMAAFIANVKPLIGSDTAAMRAVCRQVKYLMNYNIPLEQYRTIYKDLRAAFSPQESNDICKQNLNLLLSDTMDKMAAVKPNIQGFAPPSNAVPPPAHLSPQQLAAVSCTDPLILVQSGAGTGKALPLDEPVLTPAGWKPMGDLKAGDEVIGSDGLPHTVLRIHEQGLKPGYELEFQDGSRTRCCGEHLWTVLTGKNDDPVTLTTDEWLSSEYKNTGRLPMVRPVNYANQDAGLPIDPYVLGALLANAKFNSGAVTYAKQRGPVLSKMSKAASACGWKLVPDKAAPDRVPKWSFEGGTPIEDILEGLGLIVHSSKKFIPDAYAMSSPDNRRRLLNGIFDGHGFRRAPDNCPVFQTEAKRLAYDACEIAWSLGLSAAVKRHERRNHVTWDLFLYDPSWDPFTVPVCEVKTTNRSQAIPRRVKSATPFDPVPMRCIEVDAPDKLYVTRDFVVTHNSTMILGRIDHMVQNGVNPNDVMVLSFTNAAADHILEKNPRLKSMTIAKMIHTIYDLNFPTHELSETATLENTIDIYYPKQLGQPRGIVDDFQRHLRHLRKNEPNAYTEMNSFIELNYDEVIAILDTVRQTTLDLEIIICYQRIDYLIEPPNIASKYLIIDEVQDNSVFEFVYVLRYITKHQEPLFMVGDCSQTLYEFRSSNPRALNILEASQVFTTYQLTTNYRSNQEILDFANVVLDRIEANQFARIRLRANSLAPVTEQSFMDKVQLNYNRYRVKADVEANLPSIFASDIRPYVDECLKRDEQVAFLAYQRHHVGLFGDILKQQYPNLSCVSLVSEKAFTSTVMSQFISKYWSGIQFMPYTAIPAIVIREIMSHMSDLTKNPTKAQAAVQKMLGEWINEQGNLMDTWIQQAIAGQMGEQELLDRIKDNMLKFEIQNNGKYQSRIARENKQTKTSDAVNTANFLLSTIHGAKGLEFQNVVILYLADNDMSEPDKRMYYVAMTRAMNSEYVLAFGPTVSSRIQTDYIDILSKLHDIAPSPNSFVTQLQTAMKGSKRIKI